MTAISFLALLILIDRHHFYINNCQEMLHTTKVLLHTAMDLMRTEEGEEEGEEEGKGREVTTRAKK